MVMYWALVFFLVALATGVLTVTGVLPLSSGLAEGLIGLFAVLSGFLVLLGAASSATARPRPH